MPPLSVIERSERGLEEEVLKENRLDKNNVTLTVLPPEQRCEGLQQIIDDIGNQFDKGDNHIITLNDAESIYKNDVRALSNGARALTGKGINGWDVTYFGVDSSVGCRTYQIKRPAEGVTPEQLAKENQQETDLILTDFFLGKDLPFENKALVRYVVGYIEHKKKKDFNILCLALSNVGDGEVRELFTLDFLLKRRKENVRTYKDLIPFVEAIEKHLLERYGQTPEAFIRGEVNRHEYFEGERGHQLVGREIVLDYFRKYGNGSREALERSELVGVLD